MIPDYARSILEKFEGVKSSGDTGRQFVARCPAHADSQQSLGIGVADDRVLLKCYAGCRVEEVVDALGIKLKDLYPKGDKAPKRGKEGVTVNRLAFEKRIPADWLRSACGLEDFTDGSGRKVDIPYRDETGAELFRRVRSALRAKEGTYYKVKGSKPVLYGLWMLAEFRRRGGPLIIVEGETDCWALWSHGYNAIGIPGATNDKVIDRVSIVEGFTDVVVWKEPDAAGSTFASAIAQRLRSVGYTGAIRVASLEGAKDPADIQAKHASEFKTAFEPVLTNAKPWESTPAQLAPLPSNLPKTVKRIEVELRQTGISEWGEFELTDSGNAGRMEKLHGGDLRFVAAWGKWFVWDGRRWTEDTTLEVYRRANQTVLSLILEAQVSPGRSGIEECLKWSVKSQSVRGIEAMIRLARSQGRIPASHDKFDKHPWLMNCQNGTVDLRTGELYAHRRDDLLTSISPTAYDANAKAPTWDSFLEKVFPLDATDPTRGGDPVMIGYVQRLLGYCVTGVVRVNALPIFWGGGANGKSTLLDVVQDVMGKSYAMQAPAGFLMTKHGDSHPTELADLWGKRFVVTTETNHNRKLDEALVKQLTGGDKIRARRMREDFWEFDPTHKLVLCTNHRPRVPNTDEGIWRRLLLVPFMVKFWDPDRETGHDMLRQDKNLKDKLRAESSGILAWLVQGCRNWLVQGLDQPEKVARMTSEYRQDEDVFGRFLGEKYKQELNSRILLKDLSKDFSDWCETNGERGWTSRQISSELKARGYETRPATANKVTVFGLVPAEPAKFDADTLDDWRS